jgi:ankyrin repeat protein
MFGRPTLRLATLVLLVLSAGCLCSNDPTEKKDIDQGHDQGQLPIIIMDVYCIEYPLHAAVIASDTDRVRSCLVSNYEVNALDSLGYPPLIYAMDSVSKVEIARLLLDAGAEPNGRSDSDDITALLAAVSMLPVCSGFGNDDGNLQVLTIMRLLLDHGATVDAGDSEGTTPLMVCAKRGKKYWPLASLLISYGASLEAVDLLGHSPLDYADSATREFLLDEFQKKPGH